MVRACVHNLKAEARLHQRENIRARYENVVGQQAAIAPARMQPRGQGRLCKVENSFIIVWLFAEPRLHQPAVVGPLKADRSCHL